MKITQKVLTASLLGLASLGTVHAKHVVVGSSTTSETNVETPITVTAGARGPIVQWRANTSISSNLTQGDSLGTITVLVPAAPQSCILLMKSPDGDDATGIYKLKKNGSEGGPGNYIKASVLDAEGNVMATTTDYETLRAVPATKCSTTLNVVARDGQNVAGGEYNGSIQFIGYLP